MAESMHLWQCLLKFIVFYWMFYFKWIDLTFKEKWTFSMSKQIEPSQLLQLEDFSSHYESAFLYLEPSFTEHVRHFSRGRILGRVYTAYFANFSWKCLFTSRYNNNLYKIFKIILLLMAKCMGNEGSKSFKFKRLLGTMSGCSVGDHCCFFFLQAKEA